MAIAWDSDMADSRSAMVRAEPGSSARIQRQHDEWPRKRKTNIILTCIIIAICIIIAVYFIVREEDAKKSETLFPPDPEEQQPPSHSHFHIFKKGAVCTDAPQCSLIGRNILQRNGSAVDATIAAMFCNGIINMQSMGLGGGFLMTIYKRDTQTATTLNAREAAPLKATEDMFKDNPKASLIGPLSIGVPGELRGYWEAHKKFGVLPWRELIEPTLEFCDNGFNLSKVLHDGVLTNKLAVEDESLRNMYFEEGTKKIKMKGTLIKPDKAFCNSLRIIAEKGGDELYNGSLADLLVQDFKDIGSIITKEDLEKYRPKWKDPINVSLPHNDKLYSIPPPGSGALLGFMLNILRGYNFNGDSIADVNSTIQTYHRIIEAFKYAYAKRTTLGDADFVNIEGIIRNLTSPEFGDSIRKLINDSQTYNDESHYGAQFYNQPDQGTAHVSVLAQNGDAVSVTSTINFYFGSAITTKRTGIVMNNIMDDFSSPGFVNQFNVPGSPANAIRPEKRPMSSMSPTIIVDGNGDVRMVIGASGGTKITTSIALVVMRSLWFEQTIKQAVDAPRIHHQLFPMEIAYEYGNMKQVVEGLQTLGHKTKRYGDRGSVICAIYKNETALYSNADYRKGGDVYGVD